MAEGLQKESREGTGCKNCSSSIIQVLFIGKTLLGHLGKSHYLITRSQKAQNKSQISVGLAAGSSQVVCANIAAAGK